MATVAWEDSRGPGGGVERVRSWVAGSVSGQCGDIEGGPPRASQRRAHNRQAKKHRSNQEGQPVTAEMSAWGLLATAAWFHKSLNAALVVKLGWGGWWAPRR